MKSLLAPALCFSLLLPSVALTVNEASPTALRGMLSFNLSGPFSLAMCAAFFWRLTLTPAQVLRLFLLLVAPVVAIGTLVAYNIATAEHLTFSFESNPEPSGGFGPNQVSLALGLGALACLWCQLERGVRWPARIVLFILMLWLGAHCALTFSRGGMLGASASAAVALALLLLDADARKKLLLVVPLLVYLALYVIWPALVDFTGGNLAVRYSETGLSNRDELGLQDIDIWMSHPVFGVGPGLSPFHHFGGVIAHTEFTRVLAEHGFFGAVAMALMVVIGVFNIFRAPSPREKALVASALTLGLLFMLNSAMRTVAPSFMYGLSCCRFVVPRALRRARGRGTESGLAHRGDGAGRPPSILDRMTIEPPALATTRIRPASASVTAARSRNCVTPPLGFLHALLVSPVLVLVVRCPVGARGRDRVESTRPCRLPRPAAVADGDLPRGCTSPRPRAIPATWARPRSRSISPVRCLPAARFGPGDLLWLRGGIYFGNFRSELSGHRGRLHRRRAVSGRARHPRRRLGPSGRAVLRVDGAHTVYWGFEVTNSTPRPAGPRQGHRRRRVRAVHEVHQPGGPPHRQRHRRVDSGARGRGLRQPDLRGWLGRRGSGTRPLDLHPEQHVDETGRRQRPVRWPQLRCSRLHAAAARSTTCTSRATSRSITDRGPRPAGPRPISWSAGARWRSTALVLSNYAYYPWPSVGRNADVGYIDGCADALIRGNYLAGGVAVRPHQMQ